MTTATIKHCKLCESNGIKTVLLGGLVCARCDRVKCRCGYRLAGGTEKLCPHCRDDVRLSTFMRRGGPK